MYKKNNGKKVIFNSQQKITLKTNNVEDINIIMSSLDAQKNYDSYFMYIPDKSNIEKNNYLIDIKKSVENVLDSLVKCGKIDNVDRNYFQDRYMSENIISFEEIAKKNNISRQAVHQRIQKVIRYLKHNKILKAVWQER